MAAPFVSNFEEAANVATDYINSIENLPKEVEHLLDEIRIKDEKCQELLQDVARDQTRYVRSTLKSVSGPSFSLGFYRRRSTSPTPTPVAANSKVHLPEVIARTYAEIAALNDEKIVLAQTLIELLSLTKARLDVDLSKVKTLQGEPLEDNRPPFLPTQSAQSHTSTSIDRRHDTNSGMNAVVQINQSLRNAAMSMQSDAAGRGYKKRRITATNTAIKLSPTRGFSPQTFSRSRPSRQAQIMEPDDDDPDADAEGEEEYEGEEGEEDMTLYCFCKKQSDAGDMIGCDNPSCQYQWFHISCVGVKHPFPDKWFCPDCTKKGSTTEKRKWRKK